MAMCLAGPCVVSFDSKDYVKTFCLFSQNQPTHYYKKNFRDKKTNFELKPL